MKIFRSIRWRLLLWYGALLALILAGLGTLAYQHERTVRLGVIDRDLQSRVSLLASALHPDDHRRGGSPPPPADPRAPGKTHSIPPEGKALRLTPAEAAQFQGSGGFYYATQLQNGPEAFSPNAPAAITFPSSNDDVVRTRDGYREAWLFPAPGDCVLAGVSLADEQAEMLRYLGMLTAVGTCVLGIALVGGWLLTTHALRPIDSITTAAREIAAGDLSHRIDAGETESELGGLADLLNTTFVRLEAAFAEQRRFTADAAHELRTPISVILTHAQIALLDKRLDAEQHETAAAIERAAQRMRRMVESLLQLARLDAKQDSAPRELIDLAAIASDTVELLRPIAVKRSVTVTTNLQPLKVRGDVVGLGQVVANLVDNAIHYGREGGTVQVTVSPDESDARCAQITVTDNGAGIAPEHIGHIFDRFYRVDKARTGEFGRTGLGLAISKAIVEGHGGTITVQSRVGEGTAFIVRLPEV